jgi:hypothetical protein
VKAGNQLKDTKNNDIRPAQEQRGYLDAPGKQNAGNRSRHSQHTPQPVALASPLTTVRIRVFLSERPSLR